MHSTDCPLVYVLENVVVCVAGACCCVAQQRHRRLLLWPNSHRIRSDSFIFFAFLQLAATAAYAVIITSVLAVFSFICIRV